MGVHTEHFDYIVVGGGSGGSTVAGRLGQAGARVLVLEAGGTDRRPDVLIPAGLPLVYRTCNWKYTPEPDPTRGGANDAWPAGKILGGGGSINATVFVRGNRADFDGWARQGATGWEYEAVLADFRRMESWTGGASDYRGGSGPISVDFQAISHVANEPFVGAAQTAGHTFTPDYNGEQQVGVGHVQVNQRRGIRSQASREYLSRLPVTEPVTVRTHSCATRLLFAGDRVIGVEYVRRGCVQRSYAAQEVIVSCGALATPKLLMLSGIGPAQPLRELGITVRVDASNVGANLQEHPAIPQRWVSKVPTLNELGPLAAARALHQYATTRKGIIAATVYQAQVIHRLSPDVDAPDIQLGFGCFSTEKTVGKDGKVKVGPSRKAGLQVTTNFLHPRYRGQLTLRSADPLAPPVIRHQLLGSEQDTRDLLAGMAEARHIMAQPEMREYVGQQFEPERACRTDEDWLRFLRENATNGAHPVGTCAMGDADAVVDPQLRVRGVSGLRVSDASVMPSLTSGNTNAATMMIGERAAREILRTADPTLEHDLTKD